MSQISVYTHTSGPGSGTVVSVSAGPGISITGNPNVNPTVNNTGVLSITGNTGPAETGAIMVITANSTPIFAGSGTTETLDFNLANLVLGSSLPSLTSATDSVGMGSAVLNSVTSGSFNSAYGFRSLSNISSGSENSAYGYESLVALLTGNNNLAFGGSAGSAYVGSESNNIVLNNAGIVGDNNTIRIGVQGSGSGQQNKAFIAGVVGVTVSNPSTVVINTATGQLGVASGGGTPIETLTGDSGGAIGPTAGNITITGGTSGAIFTGSGSTLTESFNFLALPNTNINATVGYISFGGNRFISNYGTDNTFVGQVAGNATLTTASAVDNTGLGTGVLFSLTTGSRNCGIGEGTLISLTTGVSNSIVGTEAANTLIGASRNSVLGDGALDNATSTSDNIAIGFDAADAFSTNESSNIIIGSNGVIGDNHTIRIGTQGSGTRQQNLAFMAGIVGVSPATPVFTTINSSTGQLGVSQGLSTTAGGLVTNTKQSAFHVYQSTSPSNVTGDGTAYTLALNTTVFDQNSDFNTGTFTFTAPVTGRYFFNAAVIYTNVIAETTMQIQINTTSSNYNGSYETGMGVVAVGGFLGSNMAVFTNMTAADTTVFVVIASGSTKSVGIDGARSFTYAGGYLVC